MKWIWDFDVISINFCLLFDNLRLFFLFHILRCFVFDSCACSMDSILIHAQDINKLHNHHICSECLIVSVQLFGPKINDMNGVRRWNHLMKSIRTAFLLILTAVDVLWWRIVAVCLAQIIQYIRRKKWFTRKWAFHSTYICNFHQVERPTIVSLLVVIHLHFWNFSLLRYFSCCVFSCCVPSFEFFPQQSLSFGIHFFCLIQHNECLTQFLFRSIIPLFAAAVHNSAAGFVLLCCCCLFWNISSYIRLCTYGRCQCWWCMILSSNNFMNFVQRCFPLMPHSPFFVKYQNNTKQSTSERERKYECELVKWKCDFIFIQWHEKRICMLEKNECECQSWLSWMT